MEDSRLGLFQYKLNRIKEDYDKIKNNKGKKEDILEELKTIIDQCNIFEEYNLKYLESLKSVETEKNLNVYLEKYEGSITSNKFNETFPNKKDRIIKISPLKKIQLLIFDIINLEGLSKPEQEIKLKSIFEKIKSIKIYKLKNLKLVNMKIKMI